MRTKRGQITVFIILGIIIVALIAILGLLYSQGIIFSLGEEESRQVLGSQIEPLRSYVAECVSRSSVAGLNFLGEHGGYNDYIKKGLTKIEYAGDKVVVVVNTQRGPVNRFLSEEEFEDQFALYMKNQGKDSLDSCLDGFTGFKQQGYAISPGAREITMDLSRETVNVNVDWVITIRKGRARLPVEQKEVKIPMLAQKVFGIATDITNNEASGIAFEGEEIDRYVANNPSKFRNVDFVFENYPSFNQKIFMLTTESQGPLEEEFRLYFAVDRGLPL